MRRLEQNFVGMVMALSIADLEYKRAGRFLGLCSRLRVLILRCIAGKIL